MFNKGEKIMKRILVLLLSIALVVLSCPGTAHAEGELQLYAASAVLMDADTGRVLYGKDADTERPMASTTKIMTLILVLEYGNLDDYVTVSDYASKMPDVQLGIRAGEQYKLEDLLYSMMLESHNDSACAIAEHVGGSVEDFAVMMNKKAAEIGLSHTYFITPNGLDAEDENGIHRTTAKELALIMRYCVFQSEEKDKFQAICQTRSYSFSDREGKRQFTVNNKNALLDQMDGVLAGKTGFTGNAGYCYVAAVNKNGKNFIVVLLACGWPNNKSYKWSDTKALLAYGDEKYQYTDVDVQTYTPRNVEVKDGLSETVPGYAVGTCRLLLGASDTLLLREIYDRELCAPVLEGDRIGLLVLMVNGDTMATYPIYAKSSVQKKDFSYYMYYVFDEFFY